VNDCYSKVLTCVPLDSVLLLPLESVSLSLYISLIANLSLGYSNSELAQSWLAIGCEHSLKCVQPSHVFCYSHPALSPFLNLSPVSFIVRVGIEESPMVSSAVCAISARMNFSISLSFGLGGSSPAAFRMTFGEIVVLL